MNWFNYVGLIIIIILLIPNIIALVKKPEWLIRTYKNKKLELVEFVCRIGSIIFMIFNIPYLTLGLITDDFFVVYVFVNSLLAVLYVNFFIVCFKSHNKLRGYTLSIIPTLIFFLSGIFLLNFPLILFSIGFGISHIYLSIKNIQEEENPPKRKVLRNIANVIISVFSVIILFALSAILYLTFVEYNPKQVEESEIYNNQSELVSLNQEYTILTWNVGYGALDKDSDFFMDGGTQSKSSSKDAVLNNINAIALNTLSHNPDFVFYQEVDIDSTRSRNVDELSLLINKFSNYTYTRALNYKCEYVPIPIPPLGKVESGLLTFSKYNITSSNRFSLPSTFSWPVKVANLKRCLSINRIKIEGSEKELVLINFHLEAYDDGDAKIAQTKVLLSILKEEYEAGNYVIAGGDFNQTFSSTMNYYPVYNENLWKPGVIEDSDFTEIGYQVCFDSKATCRLLNHPYVNEDPTVNNQFYIIDGFVVSNNVIVDSSSGVIDYQFENTDHNPYKLIFKLGL